MTTPQSNPKLIKHDKKDVSTAVRVFELLDVVSHANPHLGLSLSEISKSLKASKSTAHRYLQTLERLGVIERNERDNYHLGWKMLNLAGDYLNNLDLPNLADPYMRDLSKKTQETVHLSVPTNNEVIYIGKVNSPHSIQMVARIGITMPMHCTSLGKSILAYLPDDQVNEIIQQGLPVKTPNTITSPENLRNNLEQVRLMGYAVDDVENEEGVRCIGAPVFNFSQHVIAGISISGPDNRITSERIQKLGLIVKETALAISRRMGYPK